MSMTQRQKKLRKKVYTYEQLEAILHAHSTGARRSSSLYGSVVAAPSRAWPCAIAIAYETDRLVVPLAYVYRAANGGTAYSVAGPDTYYRRQNRQRHERIRETWKRYVRAFTPYNERRVFADDIRMHYIVRDGVATHVPRLPGVWQHVPRGLLPAPKNWAKPFEHRKYKTLARRCRLFATRLKRALADGPPCVVQVFDELHGYHAHIPFVGATLHVCTAPTAAQNGKRLLIKVGPYDDAGRTHHHVDGDYARKHSQFFAVEEGKSWRDGGMRWKCSKDAIAGITEWILGDLYIPGPDSF
jgi:hypothetical protein